MSRTMHGAGRTDGRSATGRTGRAGAFSGLLGEGARSGIPMPPGAVELLLRSDAELVAARLAAPADRLVHAHLGALRAGAAVLAVTGRPGGRPAPRTVWDMVAAVAPELEAWTAWFAAGAGLRAAVESGRAEVDDERADRTLAVAEDFQDAVRRLLGVDGVGQGVLALRAS